MNRVRVLLADDSPSIRAALKALLKTAEGIEVVGEAEDGLAAVDLATAVRPDVITMDISMPRLDGLAAIGAIMAISPTRILVVCDTSDHERTELAFRAIAAGALEVVPKPAAARGEAFAVFGRRLVDAIRAMATVPVVSRKKPSAAKMLARSRERLVDVIGVVASTGGPPALAELLGQIGESLPLPILVAQHLAFGFTPGLVRWLADASRLPVVIARDGDAAKPGTVYLPEDGHDLELDKGDVLRVRDGGELAPSGDRLLASLAAICGARAAGVVLTGMGDDGARGLLAITRAGGIAMAQEEASCVVAGMSNAALAIGAVRDQLPISGIAQAIVRLGAGAR